MESSPLRALSGATLLPSLALAGALLLPSSAGAGGLGPGIVLHQVAPPQSPLTGIQTLAVGTFQGFGGTTVADGIRAALQDSEPSVGGAAFAGLGKALAGNAVDAVSEAAAGTVEGVTHGLVKGSAVDKLVGGTGDVLVDQIEDRRVTLDDGLHIDVYRLVTAKADAVLSGSVDQSANDEAYKVKEARKDSSGNFVKDSSGAIIYDEVPCTKRTVTVTVQWAITGPGGPALEQSRATSAQDSRCGEDRGNLASANVLATTALGSPGPDIVNSFAPTWRQVRVDMNRDKAVNSDLKIAQAGQPWVAACNMFNVLKGDSYNADILYDVGATAEVMGDLDTAATYYQRALSSVGNRAAAGSLARVQQRRAELQTMQDAFGQTYTIPPMDFGTCPPLPDGTRMVTKKEVELLADHADGDLIATLPKGIQVFVAEDEAADGMLHVRLIDGNEGWIAEKTVK